MAITKTRFKELGITKVTTNCWMFVDLTGDKIRQVGLQYRTKMEALADLTQYAKDFGCEGA